MNIFVKNRIYSFDEISDICIENDMITVDCIKDEEMVSVEKFIDGELGGDCLFEFDRVGDDQFVLRWSETNHPND